MCANSSSGISIVVLFDILFLRCIYIYIDTTVRVCMYVCYQMSLYNAEYYTQAYVRACVYACAADISQNYVNKNSVNVIFAVIRSFNPTGPVYTE